LKTFSTLQLEVSGKRQGSRLRRLKRATAAIMSRWARPSVAGATHDVIYQTFSEKSAGFVVTGIE
jgi:hypothetical protein